MIERKFVNERVRSDLLEEFVSDSLKNVGLSHVKMTRTPLGEKITIFASRPGLVVGRKGENIKKLTSLLKKRFSLENPQIEIAEVDNPHTDARIIAERIASTLERFGSQKFKAVAHKTLNDVMASGALGVQITIAGKVPSARAKRWRFYAGYLKKSGQLAMEGVKHAVSTATLKSGAIGIKVWIMPNIMRPDDISVSEEHAEVEETVKEKPKKQVKKKTTKKRAVRKKNIKKAKESQEPKQKEEKGRPKEASKKKTEVKEEDARPKKENTEDKR